MRVQKKSFVRATKISCTDLAKTKSNMLMFGKPLVILAALPKERYINFVDANLLCLGVFQKVRNEGSRRSAVRAEPIKEHETVDMKLAHLF